VTDERPADPSSSSHKRHNFPKKLNLRAKRDYDAVFDARTRESRGPLSVGARPNDLVHCRFGMSVSRKVGTAVRRNRIRRLLRESFRLMQHDLPRSYDFVVVVRPHEPLALAEYQRLLSVIVLKLHNTWQRRPTGKDTEVHPGSWMSKEGPKERRDNVVKQPEN
jgi:ribonuclease P protein component